METVLSSAVMAMVVDAVTIAVSGLSCYYSAVAATAALSSAVITVDVTTTVVDANCKQVLRYSVNA